MRCEECKDKEATYIWLDHEPDRLVPLCDGCYHKIVQMFGEDQIEAYETDDPFFLVFLVDAVNKRFKWHSDILKRLRNEIRFREAEINRLRKIAGLDWIKKRRLRYSSNPIS